MSEFDQLLHSKKTEQLLSESKKLEQLIHEPETQEIIQLLNQNTGGNIKSAAEQAAKGDTRPLIEAIQALMKSPNGAQLIQQMKTKFK